MSLETPWLGSSTSSSATIIPLTRYHWEPLLCLDLSRTLFMSTQAPRTSPQIQLLSELSMPQPFTFLFLGRATSGLLWMV